MQASCLETSKSHTATQRRQGRIVHICRGSAIWHSSECIHHLLAKQSIRPTARVSFCKEASPHMHDTKNRRASSPANLSDQRTIQYAWHHHTATSGGFAEPAAQKDALISDGIDQNNIAYMY